MEGFGGSVAGGGRYDKMIGKFTGVDTPACGFSIGFERIVTILLDQEKHIQSSIPKKACLLYTSRRRRILQAGFFFIETQVR